MKKLLIALAMVLSLAGCAILEESSNTKTFAVQYATLKLLEESDSIDAQEVLDATQKVRMIISEDEQLSLTALSSSFRDKVDISSLQPSDQLLVNAIIRRVESTVTSGLDIDTDVITDSQTITLLQLLDDIDEAASIAK